MMIKQSDYNIFSLSSRNLQTCETMSPPGPSPEINSTCWNAIDPNATDPIDGIQVGCDNVACEAAVCACDPYCCGNRWDLACRGYFHKGNYADKENFFNNGCSASILCCEDQLLYPETIVEEEVEEPADLTVSFSKETTMNGEGRSTDSGATIHCKTRHICVALLICIGFIAI